MKLVKYSLIFFFVTITFQSLAQSSAELKRKKEELTRQIEALNRSLNNTASSKKLSLKQINTLNAQIRLREEKINTINSEVRVLDNQIANSTNTVHNLQSQLEKLKKEYAGMILFAFRNQSAYSKLMFVFAAKDFNQAYKRLKYLQQFGEYRKKQAQYIVETQKDLRAKIVQLDHDKDQKSELLTDQEKEKENLGKTKSTQSATLSKLTKQEKLFKSQLKQKQDETARLNRAIQAAINREIAEEKRKAEEAARAAAAKAKADNKDAPDKPAAPKSSNIFAATPEAIKLSSDFLGSRGNLPWPVANGTVIEGFGSHKYGVNVSTDNEGIDIRTASGSAVRAVFSGEVIAVSDIGGSYFVMIRHGEYFSVYAKLKSASVSKGQKVSVKQTIGIAGTDPDTDAGELHFEIRKGSSVTPLNPQGWLAN